MENEWTGGNSFSQITFIFEVLTYCFGVILVLFAVLFSLITVDEGKKKYLSIH